MAALLEWTEDLAGSGCRTWLGVDAGLGSEWMEDLAGSGWRTWLGVDGGLGSEWMQDLAGIYRPPRSNENYLECLCSSIRNISSNNRKSIVWIGGDLNLPDIEWSSSSVIGHRYPQSLSNNFITTLAESGLDQIVSFPTRLDNTLDLFLTNRPSCINKCLPIPGISDNEIVFVDTDIKPKRQRPVRRKIYLWNKADMQQIRCEGNKMKDEFVTKFDASSPVSEMWDTIELKLSKILDLVPSKFTSSRFNQPWITRKIKQLSRQKQRAYNKACSHRRHRNHRHWARYNVLKKRMQNACREAYNNYINNIVCPDLKSNPKRFWSHISSKRCDNNGVAPLRGPRGATYTGSKDKANILNDQFCSVFNKDEDPSTMPVLGPSPFPTMDHIQINANGVIKLLKKINPHKATGPDNIPARLLKELANSLGPVLSILYQASLDSGDLPEIWKSATVAPVFKKGDRNKPANYRPISLTAICCNLLEHIIHSSIMQHFQDYNILSDNQHGFRKARSCESQLIITMDDIAHNLDEGLQTDLILLDFSKAFDKVPHLRLLHKLKYYGIDGSALTWISNFLQGCISEDSSVRLFADDSAIYRVINNIDDADQLQQDLNTMQEWERKWLMEFHPEKCQVLRITKRRKPRSAARYIMNNYSRDSSVNTMLSKLGWESLQHRRAISKVTMMYRITNKLIDIPDNHLIQVNSSTRGNSQKFLIPPTRTTLLKGSFFPDTIHLWNSLPQQIVESPTLDVFKTRVNGVTFR
ncbi:uncharacterized protein LOC119735343 [Patiria miniata]|uniref:Reverse transcriptase domain-containing protein n=1 Tax=Patiria miniata TaxID=46514 RepID=A0A914AMK2_PATMI|nr:uncharacterized protein LOC119735343 [Patiria miniata]